MIRLMVVGQNQRYYPKLLIYFLLSLLNKKGREYIKKYHFPSAEDSSRGVGIIYHTYGFRMAPVCLWR